MFKFFATINIAFLLVSNSATAGIFDHFKDSKTGEFDASDWLLEQQGILPVPIIISDPAVGYGAGLAGVFFHKDEDQVDEEGVPLVTPSISAVAAAITENDSWFAGGAHLGIWKNDSIHYTGILGYADLNLNFFAGNQNDDFPGFAFEIQGTFTNHELLFRLADSNWFLGASYQYLNADLTLLTGIEIPILKELFGKIFLGSERSSGVSGIIEYNSRDNDFSPTTGQFLRFEALFNREALGGDDDYEAYDATALFWWPMQSLITGLRLEAEAAHGDTPFYAIPFIDLRGIPSLRYQGEAVSVVETELTWNITNRYAVLGFIGAGWAADTFSELDQSDTIIAKGAGFRYQIARKLGLWSGFDVAVGPEDTVFYIQAGSAW